MGQEKWDNKDLKDVKCTRGRWLIKYHMCAYTDTYIHILREIQDMLFSRILCFVFSICVVKFNEA